MPSNVKLASCSCWWRTVLLLRIGRINLAVVGDGLRMIVPHQWVKGDENQILRQEERQHEEDGEELTRSSSLLSNHSSND